MSDSKQPAVLPVTLVIYDYDYGWICEELNDGEYEITDQCESGHTEAARRLAFKEGCELAAKRGGKCRHYYEWPASVEEKHREYTRAAVDKDSSYVNPEVILVGKIWTPERLKQLQKMVDEIPELIELVAADCGRDYIDRPTIYQRGQQWRYHKVRAGNEWEDGDTPLAAVKSLDRSQSSQCAPQPNIETGLRDSRGQMIRVGDRVKTAVTANTDFHGEWTIYEVVLRGIVPVLLYVTSEKGDKLPRGYTGCSLSDRYDPKMFLWANDLNDVRPVDDLFVVNDPKSSSDQGVD